MSFCLATGTFNILEAAVASHVKRVVYALCFHLRPGRGFSHDRTAPWLWQPDDLRSGETLRRRTSPQLLRDVRPGQCRAPLFQRVWAMDGHLRGLYGSHDSLDGAS